MLYCLSPSHTCYSITMQSHYSMRAHRWNMYQHTICRHPMMTVQSSLQDPKTSM